MGKIDRADPTGHGTSFQGTVHQKPNLVFSFRVGRLYYRCRWLLKWFVQAAELSSGVQLLNSLEELLVYVVEFYPDNSPDSLVTRLKNYRQELSASLVVKLPMKHSTKPRSDT